jgi:putative oxidoreductase
MKYLVLLGRFFYSQIFLATILTHFSSKAVDYASSAGVPMPAVLVPLSGVIAILGGLSILLGYKARIGAWLIVIFLVPVTLMMHNWWAVTDPMMRQIQHAMFHKNISMLGAALLITYFGSGPLSVDSHLKSTETKTNNI